MRKLKEYIATALIVSMMCGQALTVPAASAEAKAPNGIYQNDEGYGIYLKDGELVKNEFEEIDDSRYYFKDDGTMASDELFEHGITDEDELSMESYAYPSGKVAIGKWVRIEDGHICGNAEGDWYRFRGKENWDLRGVAYKDYLFTEEAKSSSTGKKSYYFDEEGKMISREFVEVGDDDNYDTSYFEYEGQRSEKKWLYIDGDWYYFLPNGALNTAPLNNEFNLIDDNTASDSNAKASASNAVYEFASSGELISEVEPYPTIQALHLKSEVPEVIEVGQEVELVFDIELASASNAKNNELGYSGGTRYEDSKINAKAHDVWLEPYGEYEIEDSGNNLYSLEYNVNPDGKTLEVFYKPNYPGVMDIKAVIDDVESDSVSVESEWPETEESVKVNAITDLLNKPGADVVAAVRNIVYMLGMIDDSSKVKDVWLQKEDSIKTLEKDYLLANRVKKQDSVVSAAAETLLGSGTMDIIGAGLNADEGETVGLAIDVAKNLKLDKSYPRQRAFDLSCGDMTEFEIPVIVKMPLPKGISKDGLVLYHDHEGTITKLDYKLSDNMVTFVTDGMSTFAFAGNAETNQGGGSGSGGSSSGGGGGSSIGSSAAGTVTTDAKKGHVNSLTGIITGSGSGYSSWNSDEKGWKLQYADGTFAAGTMMTGTDGNTYEQPAWEQINGAWYPFGADGYIKSGMVYDPALGGTFYIDINTGMKTGWQNIDGIWHYFNTKADGKNGIMLTDTVVDGYYIDANGVWDGQDKKAV